MPRVVVLCSRACAKPLCKGGDSDRGTSAEHPLGWTPPPLHPLLQLDFAPKKNQWLRLHPFKAQLCHETKVWKEFQPSYPGIIKGRQRRQYLEKSKEHAREKKNRRKGRGRGIITCAHFLASRYQHHAFL